MLEHAHFDCSIWRNRIDSGFSRMSRSDVHFATSREGRSKPSTSIRVRPCRHSIWTMKSVYAMRTESSHSNWVKCFVHMTL